MKLLGSRLLLLAAYFTFSSAYFASTLNKTSSEDASFSHLSDQYGLQNPIVNPSLKSEQNTFSFNAIYQGEAVSITWEIEKPKEGSYYMVQRSDDGTEWFTIGGIAIREKLDFKKKYEMVDANLRAKTYHYKLKEIRPDGSIVYSPSVAVFVGNDKPLAVYPNPVESFLYFDLPTNLKKDASLQILDQSGRVIFKKMLNETFDGLTQRINIENLATGIYLIRIHSGNLRYSGRIFKK